MIRFFTLAAMAAGLTVFGQVGNLGLSTNTLNFSAVAGTSLPQSQVVGVTSTGAALPLMVSTRYLTAAEGWLTATLSGSTTPANMTVTANPAGLAAGVYQGQVLVVASATQSALITVTLSVASTGPGTGLITANPTSVALVASGAQTVQTQVALTSVGQVPFQVFVATTSGGSWLSYLAGELTAPSTLTITANPAGLAPGTYNGTVAVSPTDGSAGVAIPVSFTVTPTGGTGGFTVTPNSVNFVYQLGTANPAVQTVFVSNFDGIVTYVAASSASWLRLTTNMSPTPAQSVTGSSNQSLTMQVDPSGLTPGFYNGSVNVNASNGLSQVVTVTLTVSGNALLSANPASLVFSFVPGAGTPPAQQTTIASTGLPLGFTAAANSNGWLLVSPQSGETSGANVLTISVAPGGLPSGTYTGSVSVVAGFNTVNIPVTLVVGASNQNAITATPGLLEFQAQVGSPSSTQTLTLQAASPKNFVASAAASGGNWLQVTPNTGTTPATLTVSVIPQAVGQAGTYSGIVQISNLSDATQLTVPVTMTLSATTLTATPGSLTFTLAANATGTATQAVQIGGTGGLTFTAVSNQFWLAVSPTNGTTGGNVNVTVSAANLTPGTYTGLVTLTGGGATANIPVTLNVTASTAPILTPTNLTFQYTPGMAAPAAQTVAVNTTGSSTDFTYEVQGGNWLRVEASGSTTPAVLTVTVLPVGLAPGTYRGTVTVRGTEGPDVRTAQVTLTVTAPAGPVLETALHGATGELSAIAPGMILAVKGRALGPAGGASGRITTGGAFETSYDGYRVLFDGVAAPILYISDRQINVVTPYAVAGKFSTRVTVENVTGRSEAIELRVSPDAAPGLFTLAGTGRGPAAALNEDGTVNGVDNAAAAGSVLVLYATGEGQTEPGGQDGRIIVTDLRRPVLPVEVIVGGMPAEVLYAGSAPGQVSGLMQVNVRLPADVPRGAAVPVVIRVGPAPSPEGVTVSIR
jgi:uncharacterized protein (TIGR03437 family)